MEMDKDYYWIGFDTAHAMDLVPRFRDEGGVYRDICYVLRETISLADQILEKIGD